jgi:hypothetical protein
MLWWTSPEDEAMPGIYEFRVDGWIFEVLEDGIEDEAGEGVGEEFGFLLGVAGCAVGGVTGLDFGLGKD